MRGGARGGRVFRQQQDGSNGFHRIEAKLRGEQNSDGAAGTAACCRAARQNYKSELRVESRGSGCSLQFLSNEGSKVGMFSSHFIFDVFTSGTTDNSASENEKS